MCQFENVGQNREQNHMDFWKDLFDQERAETHETLLVYFLTPWAWLIPV
jgi:hypothetical protein